MIIRFFNSHTKPINNFKVRRKRAKDFEVPYNGKKINVIEAINGQLITKKLIMEPKVSNKKIVADIENDILKIAVVNGSSFHEIVIHGT